jgi:hypothetical protein
MLDKIYILLLLLAFWAFCIIGYCLGQMDVFKHTPASEEVLK